MSKALMIQGTGSGAGKSLIVTALCRIFSNMGINVTPFKAQNMALNSYITPSGGEIGRAQALQAEAARIEPNTDMNPILLKASGEIGAQVIIHGKVYSTMKAKEYYSFKKNAWEAVKASYDRLSKRHDLIIIEGAGSPAEINLMNVDIVNMAVAKYAKSPVILVGDVERGGVFASLYGTVKLLKPTEAGLIKAFIINKFRGDLDILKPGLDMIKNKTTKPVIGVIPYIKNIGLPEEDGLALWHSLRFSHYNPRTIKITVVKIQYISNFTDFDPFIYEKDVELIYSNNPSDIESADIVIIPGSKNSVKDLLFIRENGLELSIKRAYEKGVQIIGICGGYQMLGKKIYDPYSVESSHKEIDGIGLLNIETTFQKSKITCKVEAKVEQKQMMGFPFLKDTIPLSGYEIHMGQSRGDIGLFKILRIIQGTTSSIEFDGSQNKNCWGTYIHGIFENDSFRTAILNEVRQKKGLPLVYSPIRYKEIKDNAIDNFANIVKNSIDMDFIKRIIKL